MSSKRRTRDYINKLTLFILFVKAILEEVQWALLRCDIDTPMLTHVEFRSDLFPAMEGEEKLINPDLWGKRLADFLRDGLGKQGFETKEPIAEDWGWLLPVTNAGFRVWIGCGHYQEYDDGYLCFIHPHRPRIWHLFRRVATRARIAALQRAIDKVLADEPGVRARRWWTHEEFNNRYGRKR